MHLTSIWRLLEATSALTLKAILLGQTVWQNCAIFNNLATFCLMSVCPTLLNYVKIKKHFF